MSEPRKVFNVYWCGKSDGKSPCNGGPHATREAAKTWCDRMIKAANKHGGFYGYYAIEEEDVS